MDDTLKEIIFISAAGLKERGWTAKQIKECLGEPDQLKTNPRFRSAAPMRLWNLERVFAAEQTETFSQLQAKAKSRREASTQAAERRKQKLIKMAESVPLNIKTIPLTNLVRLALRSQADYYASREDYLGDPSSIPEEVIVRWCYNYARHELSEYHDILKGNKGVPGVDDAYLIIKNRILEEAERLYPPEQLAEVVRNMRPKRKGL